MRLTMRKSEGMSDWFVIERAEHDGRTWIERTQYGNAFMTAARFSDADVEGPAAEMRDIADAIEERSEVSHTRCSVDARSEPVRFSSPRNSQRDGECTLAEALELAAVIRATLPAGKAEGGAT